MILVSFGDEADFDVEITYQRVAVDNHDGGNHDDDKDDDDKDDDDCGDDDCDIDDDGGNNVGEIAKLVLCRQCASYEEQLCFQSHRGY